MTRKQQAVKLTDDAKALNLLIGRTWVALAAIYKQMRDDRLFEEVGYESFPDWLAAVGDVGRSQAYGMIQTYEDLKETLPDDAIAQMTMANARDLTKIPATERTATLVEAATRMPNNEYRQELNQANPGIALEQRSYMGFQLELTVYEMARRALTLAKGEDDVDTDAAAFEVIISHYLSSGGDTPQYRAAKAVVETVEEIIDPGNLGAPPDAEGWGSVLVVVRRMARIFGFPERRVMPGKTGPSSIATEQVQ